MGAIGHIAAVRAAQRARSPQIARVRSRKLIVLAAAAALALAAWLFYRRNRPPPFELRWRVPAGGEAFSAALQQTTGTPMKPGHAVKLLRNGEVFDALVLDIASARQSVNVEIYIWTRGATSARILGALRTRRPGVACRVLLDAVGSGSRGDEVDRGLEEAGCEHLLFRPGGSLSRNHRKVAVIDGRIGYTGGFGIDDRWAGEAQDDEHWRDTGVRVEGPTVASMQEAIGEDWQEAGGAQFPPSDFPRLAEAGSIRAAFVRSVASPVVTRAERLTQLFLASAHKRLFIENAYFLPGRPVLDLLSARGSEGVDVRLLFPGRKSDSKLAFLWQQREYGELQQHHVRVWEYQRSMMHAKTAVVDDELSLIGSVNLDPLSLDQLEDAALVVEDRGIAAELVKMFEEDEARSLLQK